MYFRLIYNDIRKNKVITLTTLLFIVISALLMSLASILMIHLAGSIDTLMLQAKAPHFLQMHQGTLDRSRMEAFAKKNKKVEDYQTLEFLNIEGAKIQLGSQILIDNVQDNGFSIQSKKFDYLLDLDGKVIKPQPGELYVPITYMREGMTKRGDKASIAGKTFIVAGFLRDAQMNSPLASSKRFLVHEKDYEQLKTSGQIEYLIEFRLKDIASINGFETDYNAAGLEANGPRITYTLFKVINAMSDGLMIAIIILVSILVIAVALMCIRFTLLAKIEEDYQEIGVMKAIGIRHQEIKSIYLAKYGVIVAIGCLIGWLLSGCFKGILLENIRLYFGESGSSILAYIVGILGVLLIFSIMMLYINGILKRFKKISAVEAIREGQIQEKPAKTNFFKLAHKRWMSTNIFLGIKDILMRKKLYITMLIVLIISVFILIVPRNLYYTLASDNFSTYMGVGSCDIRMDIQQIPDVEGKARKVSKLLQQDSDIKSHVLLTTKNFNTILADGTKAGVKVELGNHQIFPVYYVQGKAPELENEIALSAVNASELGKKLGDTILLIVDGQEKNLQVCGIYSDITNGGKTAKATFNAEHTDAMWSVLCMSLKDPTLKKIKIDALKVKFEYAKIASLNEYIGKVFEGTMDAILKAANVSMIIAILISFLITILFLKMLIAKDRVSIAVLKATGFDSKDISVQYMARTGCMLVMAILIGILLTNTLGEALAGAVLASFGVVSFKLTLHPLSTFVLCPILMVGSVLIATLVATNQIKSIKISQYIKE
ncbi:MAG: ABC transporter permease [Cellulosilyticum sp.]|nr:ABC transporter permease [Cellulosilyticum sp.]